MLSTVVYQSTIGCMLAERSTKWANSAGAMGFWSRVRDASTLSMGDLLECLSLRQSTSRRAGGTAGLWAAPAHGPALPTTLLEETIKTNVAEMTLSCGAARG
jgi:hypothetical protein